MTTTDRPTEQFQISLEAAEHYEEAFVPAIFAEWAPLIADVAGVRQGQDVLDVACGTGIVARTVADRLAGSGSVVGVDLNEAMLTVARRRRPDITWQQGDVADLPYPDGTFDAVLCQMALMFFPDRQAAVGEMARVARPGAAVAIVVPAALADQPAYRPFVEAAARRAGPEARSLLGTYWACGDLAELAALLEGAGLEVVDTWTHLGTASFPSATALAVTEVEGSPLVERIDAETYAAIREDAERVLQPWVRADGHLDAPLRGHVVAGRRPSDG